MCISDCRETAAELARRAVGALYAA
jgi:hypothetical protein